MNFIQEQYLLIRWNTEVLRGLQYHNKEEVEQNLEI